MHQSDSTNQNILKQFLCHRYDRKIQKRFVYLCLSLTRQRLRYFRARGWTLPSVDLSVNDPLDAPANDITGKILGRGQKDTRTFGRVFEFFHNRGVTDFAKTDAESLWENFQTFLYRSIRQERSRLLDAEDPAKAKIKKTLNEALLTDEYYRWEAAHGGELVASIKYKKNLREDCPQISFEELLELVTEAFRASLNQRDLCRRIFDALDIRDDVQNYLNRRRMVRAVIIANLREMDVEGLALSAIRPTDHGLLMSAIHSAREETIDLMKKTVLARYVTKGKLTEHQADLLAIACEHYLIDLAHCFGTDSRRTYFNEAIPGVDLQMYIKRFQNILDSLISKAQSVFENLLKKLL